MNDENTPVIIGTGQLVDRDADVDNFIEPLEMLVRVAKDAADATGAGHRLLTQLDAVALVETVGWHPTNPVNLVAERIGAHTANQYVTGTGGENGTALVNFMANEIINGRSGLALIAGCNNLKVLMKARSVGRYLTWTRGGEGKAEMIGVDKPGVNALEEEYGLRQPPDIYPLFENALRAQLGLSLAEHKDLMGRMFTGFTEVAAKNPYAWFPVRRSATELTSVTAENRMISFPYPKYLNAILNTEQAAGLIICSVAQARRLGVPESQWVYWWGGAQCNEKAWWTSERPSFTESPAMDDTHTSALANAGLDVSEVDHFDLYSCFPVAVEMACKVLGLEFDDPRGFTATGGLPYAGGPASAYTLHSLAEMVRCLIENPGHKGMVTGNGWFLTKHSATILASSPIYAPRNGLIDDLPSRKMQTTAREVNPEPDGPGIVEAYTVAYGREGNPERGIVLGKTKDGSRFLANTPQDVSLLNAFVASEQIGATGKLSTVQGKVVFEP